MKAYEDYVFYRSDMPGLDIDNVKLVFDFGGNETDTEMTIKNIVVKEHSCDDGTVLPAEEPEEPEPEVTWTPDGPANFGMVLQLRMSFIMLLAGTRLLILILR